MPKYLRQWRPEINRGETIVFLKCFAFARKGSRRQQDCTHILVGFDPIALAFGFKLIKPSTPKIRKPGFTEEVMANERARRKIRGVRDMRFRLQIDISKGVKDVIKGITRLRKENKIRTKMKDAVVVGAIFSSRYSVPSESPLMGSLQREGISLLKEAAVANGAQLQLVAKAFMKHFQDQLGLFMRDFNGNSDSIERELSRIGTGETRLARARLKRHGKWQR